MSVLWQKAWHDLWHDRSRTLLAVLSIAAGVFAVGAIFGLVDQLLSIMDRDHQAVSPSHFNVILRTPVDLETVEALKDIPDLAGLEPINQLSVRYKTNPADPWKLGTLLMRPDYTQQSYDRVELNAGQWPAGGQIAVERLSSQFWDLQIGDQVIFEIDGQARAFKIGGKIRHPFVQPPPFGGQANFFIDAAGLAAFGIPEGRYGQLLGQVQTYSYARSQAAAGEIRARLAQAGAGVVVTIYQDPVRHWGRKFVEGVTLILQVMAVVSLGLSVVLVQTTLTALITQQTDQIGVLKAIGGRRGTIIRLYLAEVLVYGLLALLIALPLGAVFAWATSRWFLNLFNIAYPDFSVSWRALGLQTAAALLAPILAALWPVLAGAAVSVREALASYGLGRDFGGGAVDRFVERVGGRLFSTAAAAALGNLFRRKVRLSLSLLGLTAAGVAFLVVMSLVASIDLTLDNEMARRGYDIRIGFTREQDAGQLRSLAEAEPGVRAVEVWYSRNALLLRAGERLQDSAGLGAQLIGLPAGSGMYRPIITAGRWLQPGDGRVVVINAETAAKNGISVGDELTLNLGEPGEAAWQVVGTYQVVYDTGFIVEPLYAPLEAVAEATGQSGVGTQALARTGSQDLVAANEVADRLKERFEAQGLKVDFYTTSVKLEERAYALNQFGSVTAVLLNLAMLMAVVGGIGLMGSLGISVVERRREIGVMRAIGARSGAILKLFILEGMLQGVMAWVLAIPLAFALAQPLARRLGQTMLDINLDYAFHYPAVLLWLAAILIIATLASLLPARRATRISVRESLAYD